MLTAPPSVEQTRTCSDCAEPKALEAFGPPARAGAACVDCRRRTCVKCGRPKPVDAFAHTGTVCAECKRERRRESEMMRTDPLCPTAVNRAVDSAPDPAPARRLRAALLAARDAGRSFNAAWPLAVSAALRDLPPDEAVDWRRSFGAMRQVWAASYSRRAWPANLRPALLPPDEHE